MNDSLSDWVAGVMALGGGIVGILILAVVFMWVMMWLLIPIGVFAISGEIQKLHGILKRIEALLASSHPAAAPPPMSRGRPLADPYFHANHARKMG